MSDDPQVPDDSMARARRIDQLCDAFELAWVSGKRPVMEDALGQAAPAEKNQLLQELVPIEIFHRGKCGEQPSTNDYTRRFPWLDVSWIERLIAEQRQRLPSPPRKSEMQGSSQNLGSFLEVAPAAVATIGLLSSERIDQRIGHYRLLAQIGEGGMGTVWVAEQSVPVKRRVALKLIKPGMDSRQVLSRFEAERQALALMDHPNIAKVFDGGMTDEGRPYFVMEYVEGVPITEYCDNVRLSIQDRLKLFVKVCHAVQHAHQKGVIHRDLKPSNILVCLYDGQPIPRVIDFGLAKAINQPLTEHTLYTAHGLMVGTPLYMSPEQAEFNSLNVDTRTDVYSLGVILYELLTGTTPLERNQLKGAALVEVIRLIREVEPSKPSTKISSLSRVGSASLELIAAQRSLEPTQLSRTVRGDLDWIVVKALEKERSRRYATANGLSRDIERFLKDEPVEASPPSTTYRLRKLAKKHRGLLSGAATIAALLILGITVSTWQAIRATRAEAAARQSSGAERAAKNQALLAAAAEKQARQDAEAAAAAEKAAKQASLQREAETNAVLDFVENKIIAAARPEGQAGGLGKDVTLRQALQKGLEFIDQGFRNQPLIEARLRLTLGNSFGFLGEPQVASEQYERACHLFSTHQGADHPDTIASMNQLANSYSALGRHAEALKLREETLALLKAKLGANRPETLTGMSNLANSYNALGRLGDALKLREEALVLRKAKFGADHPGTLTSMNNLAGSYKALGRHAEALSLYEETLALRNAKLGADHPDTLASMSDLAGIYKALGRLGDALKLREETLALRQAKLGADHPETLKSMNNLALSYSALGLHADALRLHKDTLALRQKKLGADHPDTLWSMMNLASACSAASEHAEALELCRAAGQLWENAKRTDANSLYQAVCRLAVSTALIRAADPSEAAAKQADAEADRAMQSLQKAVAAGYKNAADMAQNPDLEALRDRDDFKQLLATLEASQTKAQQ